MKNTILPVLLLLLPLCAPAQLAPPVNLQAGPVLRVPAGGRPVDVAFVPRGRFLSYSLMMVVAQGTNQLYNFAEGRQNGVNTFVRSLFTNDTVAVPLSIVARLDGNFAGPELFTLALDGNATRWRSSSNLGSYRAQPAPMALRGGLPCAPTDRLVMGRYNPAGSLGNDLACWSSGPQPGLARATQLAGGTYRVEAPSPPWVTAGLGGVAVTANLNTASATAAETLLLTQPADSSGRVIRYEHTTAANGWWANASTATPRATAPPLGPTRSLALGQVDGAGALDVVLARRGLTVYPSNGLQGFSVLGTSEEYPLLPVPTEVRLADLNGDQRPEMLVLGDDGTLNVFENISRVPGRTTLFQPLPYVLATGPDAALIRVADYDLDGDLDVIVPCRGDGTVRLFRNGLRTLSAAAAAPPLALSVYPNPAQSTLEVLWEAPGRPAPGTAPLLDALGRTVQTWPAVPAAGATLDVAHLPRGVYALRVWGAGGATATRRVVLE